MRLRDERLIMALGQKKIFFLGGGGTAGGSKLIEQTLQTSFTTFCSTGTLYGTSSAATLLVENINSTSLLEIQENDSISSSAFKNLSE